MAEQRLMCNKCWREAGYECLGGVHTAMVQECSNCGEIHPISPDRHYTRESVKRYTGESLRLDNENPLIKKESEND